MNASPADLEHELADWVLREVRSMQAPGADREQVIAAIRSVLDERTLHGDEAPLTARAGGSVEALDVHRALEERLRRALAVGLNSALPSGVPPEISAPRVVVLDPTLPLTQVSATVARELETLAETVILDSGARSTRLLVVGEHTHARAIETATFTNPDGDPLELVTVRALAPLAQALRGMLAQAAPSRPGLAWRQDADAMVGHLFHDKYRIEKCLGEGGFGRVYKATEEVVGYPVAIKLLQPKFRQAARHVQEFMEEARRLFSLEHENIGGWKVFDRTPAGDWYFVMEFLQGQDLEAVLEREQRLDPGRVGQILVQTLRALEKAHFLSETEGILHLDLKPKNVFLVNGTGKYREKVKVIDFGVGQLVRRRSPTTAEEGPRPPGEGGRSSGTQQITGLTIDYASPEQLAYLLPEGQRLPLDGRSDLFSLGVMGFRMLTGEFPFDTNPPPPSEAAGFENQGHTRKARLRTRVPCRTLESTGIRVPRRLAAFLDRCLKLDREERFPDSRAALAELETIVDPPLLKRALGLAGVVGAIAIVAAVGITRWLVPAATPEFSLLQDEIALDAANPLFLGPSVSTRMLGIDRGELLDSSLPLQLVESGLGGEPLPDWSVNLGADRRLRITAPVAAVSSSRLVHVRQGALRSRSIRLVYLNPASWSAPAIEIEGWDGARRIAPTGVAVRLPVRFESNQLDANVLDRAELSWRAGGVSGGPLPMRALTGRVRGFELPMEALPLRDDECEISARVFDRAGNSHDATPLTIGIAAGPLEFTGTLDGTRVGGVVQLLATSQPILQVVTNRPATVSWSARDASGVDLGVSGSRTVDSAATIALPQLVKAREQSYSGELSVWADDSAWVFRKERPDLALVRPPPQSFTVNLGSIRVTPTLFSVAAGQRRPVTVHGAVAFSSEPELQLQLARENALPITVRFRCFEETVTASVPIGEERQLLEGRNALSSAISIPVHLPRDGAYRLHAALLLHDPVTRQDIEDSRQPSDLSVVLDRSGPSLSLEADFAPGACLSSPPGSEVGTVRVRGSDSTPHGIQAPPLSARWTCTRDFDSEISSGELPLPLDQPTVLALAAPGGRWLDGTYVLRLTGSDAAGNRNDSDTMLAWELAATGPEIALRWDVPSPETTPWTRDEDGWRIRAAASDPNGVATVRCTVIAVDVPSLREERDLEFDPASGSWKAVLGFSSDWSTRRVRLSLEAQDNRGKLSRSAPQERTLPAIARKRFPVVKLLPVAGDAGPVPESMRLVQGNSADVSAYMFRGQPDAVENRGFARDGIPVPFSAGRTRAMSIEYRPGEIQDFYLDVHEVSIGQYLAFVQAADGFANPAHWADGHPGSEARLRELLERLDAAVRGGAAELPVAEIDWNEARSYAAWVRKRLPSVVEFEYAVRGGTRYRSWSGAREGVPLVGSVHFGAAPGSGPREREFGRDVTPDHIWCLSGNVAEWTATPAYFDEAKALDKLHQFRRFRLENLRPWESTIDGLATQYYSAGGCFDARSADFFRIEELAVTDRRPNVGFRCALSAEEAEARVREETPVRFRMELAEQ